MKFSPDLLKAVDHCQHRSFITNRYNGARIAVDCGQCDYCIHKKAKKASMRVKTAGSAFRYSYFVTLTYDNEHVPLMSCSVLVKMKAILWHNEAMGAQYDVEEIPADLVAEAQEWRDKMLETIAEYDDVLMEKYFDDPSTITEDEIRVAIRKATL